MTRCENCNAFAITTPHCDRCTRLALFGTLVNQVLKLYAENMGDQWIDYMEGLDAIGELLIDGAERRENYRRALNEEIQTGQREAGAAYEDGRLELREHEEGIW